MPEIPEEIIEERAKSIWNRAYYGSHGAPERVTNWDRQPPEVREVRRQAVREDLALVWESAYRAGREDAAREIAELKRQVDYLTTQLARAVDELMAHGWDRVAAGFETGAAPSRDHRRKLLRAANLGTCPTCSAQIAEVVPFRDQIEVPSNDLYRTFEPGPLRLTLRPCGHRFLDREAEQLAEEIRRRVQSGEDQDTPGGSGG